MLIQSMPYPGGGAPPVPPAPYTRAEVVALFAGGIKGAVYDFTDGATLAVSADGSGGVPAIGSTLKWAIDLGPNGNHLRNTLPDGLPVRRATGVETSGTNYGLFNTATLGDWPAIPEPFEFVGCMEQLTYAFNGRVIGLSPDADGAILLQSGATGAIRFANGSLGPELAPGLTTEFTLAANFSSGARTQSLNGGAPQDLGFGAASANALWIGASAPGGPYAKVRFKRLLVIGRALTAGERIGVTGWASA